MMGVSDKRLTDINEDSLQYTEADWEEESYDLFVMRANPQPCPKCGRTGFYGPRAMDPGRKYRACRLCGFWQFVGHDPLRFNPTAHDCEDWPQCARAPYIWWVHPDEKRYTCPYCRQQLVIESQNVFVKSVLIVAPIDDPDHPWLKVPQNRSYPYYQRFWEHWAVTKGRVIL
ncbi:MAG: hypothetical protein AMS18_16945 [Gemmatimonas sp. SG8_17]|nr:MAG: hypothetical protein AMS18_16945 [Gemmatimonas sp. SG8_17]